MRVRPLSPGDDDVVRAVFRRTLLLGAPVAFPLPAQGAYEALCLDWYLGPGRDGAAVVETGVVEGGGGDRVPEVVGYALVCTDPAAWARWNRPRALRWAVAAGWDVVAHRGGGRRRRARFLGKRVRDAWGLWRTPDLAGCGAHAHVNLVPAARAGRAGRLLADHVDRCCRRAGWSGGHGEINAAAGQRARALERLGGRVVGRAPNHTLTWLLGRPVERLTVARPLGPDAGSPDKDGRRAA